MIECPHCGASNREASKFCGQCGRPLEAVNEVTCPMCDTSNPGDRAVCARCGARLVPLEAPVGEEPAGLEREEPDEGEEREEDLTTGELEQVEPGERIEEAVAASEEKPEEELPPWLRKLRETPSEEPAVERAVEPQEGGRPVPGELPEWLEVPPEFEHMLAEAARPEEGEIAPAEIPDWLAAMRPGEVEGGLAPEGISDRPEPKGLLKGIKGVLGIEPVLALPRRAEPRTPVFVPTLADERADRFATVAAEPLRARVEVARAGRIERLAARTVRWMIYVIVAVAVVAPILLRSDWAAATMRVSRPTAAMYDVIESLPEDAVVLVSHDYDPGVAAEMIPQAQAILHHLMERRARLINVSLAAEGVTISRGVLDQVAQEHGYQYGQDYVNLGYVVGVEVGPRSLARGFPGPGWADIVEHREFSEFPVASGVDDLGDIDLIVELAGGAESLRLWLEQVQAPRQLPMVAGVSATADPFARPYYHNRAQPQLLGLITGLVGAAEYELYSGRTGSALATMDSQSLAHIAIVLLVVFGNGAYAISRLRKG